jgi:hypothetical protein
MDNMDKNNEDVGKIKQPNKMEAGFVISPKRA